MSFESFFQAFIGPGLIAAGISLYVNNKFDKRRAKREYSTKTFGDARDSVAKSIEHAFEYFSNPAERSVKREAFMLMYEREVIRLCDLIVANSPPACQKSVDKLLIELYDFVSYLTGGSFQSPPSADDVAQVHSIASASAGLRAALSELRDYELQHDLDSRLFHASRESIGKFIAGRAYVQ